MIKKIIRQTCLIVADIIVINLAFLEALFLQYQGNVPIDAVTFYLHNMLVCTLIKLLVYRYFELYNSLWEYASVEELMKIVFAVLLSSIVNTSFLIFMGSKYYFGIYFLSMIFEIMLVGMIRFSYRFFRRFKNHYPLMKQEHEKRILIIGSGSTASLIATEIKNHALTYGQVVGFIDEDFEKLNKNIGGVKVLGNRYDIYSIAHRYKVNEIIIATPTADAKTMRMIIDECKRTESKVRIMPGIREVIGGQVSLSKIRDVEIEDLLGRDPVNLNVEEVAKYIEGKTILVTGGGGSIGSELCRQIARFLPEKLIILDVYENNAYEIQNELTKKYRDKLELDVIIASVRERESIFTIIKKSRPDVIFHAAAHKHVPLMERSPKEAIKNNVFGTKNMAEAADEYGVERFVLVSTDKAVNPTNIMGASKRICEMIIQGLNKHSKTQYSAVRFGNVLGSNGSVVPLFKKQIKEGGPLTVTHPDIIRYFMTIPEAAQLVIQSGAIARGGEIFVLDMGEPVRIYDLAVDLIHLSGLKVDEDISIEITGLRPGEKLYEELLMSEEGLKTTKYKKIHIGKPGEIDYVLLEEKLKHIDSILNELEDNGLKELLKDMVPTYKEADEVNQQDIYGKKETLVSRNNKKLHEEKKSEVKRYSTAIM